MKRVRTAMLSLAVLAAVSVGATWAAWTDYERTGNEYMVPKYRTSLEEQFNPPDNWQPGVSSQKEVWVSNRVEGEDGEMESAVPVIAKVELNQSWVRRKNVYATSSDGQSVPIPPKEGEPLPLIFKDEEGESRYAAIPGFNRDAVMVLASGRAKDAGLRLGLPYAEKPEDARGKWLLADEEPSRAGNYTLYYLGVIEPGERTPAFLLDVTMNPLLENTVRGKDTWYEKTEDGYRRVTAVTVNSQYGYDGCRYVMDIKATTVQATPDAVEHTFTGGFHEEIIHYLADQIAEPAVRDASGLEKRLTVTAGAGGRLSYVPYRDEEGKEDGNWFMSFTDMVPGGVYRDSLKVENTLGRGVQVWMRIDPRENQGAIREELLEQIDMTVTLGDRTIYEGKATGAKYGEGENLQELIPLCYLGAGETVQIRAELRLSPDIACDPVTGECRYAEQLAKIDWEFMVQSDGDTPGGNKPGGGDPGNKPGGGNPKERTSISDPEVPLTVMVPENPVPLAPLPKTGDPARVLLAAAAAAVSFLLLLILWFTGKQPKREKRGRRENFRT